MITAQLIKDDNNEIKGFSCTGHGEYGEAGEDLVCAAVSLFTINTVNSIEAFTEDKDNMVLSDDTEPGNLQVIFSRPICRETKLLLDTMFLGLESVEKLYGEKFIKVIR